MAKIWTYRFGLVAGAVLLVSLLPVQVGQATTWDEQDLLSQKDLEDEDLVDLNHPGLFPELLGVPKRVKERKPEVTPTRPPEPPPTPPTTPQRPVIEEGPIPFSKFPDLVQRIHFDYDKYNIKPEFVEGLKKNADWIKKNPQYRVLIEGHCDERGSNEYNIALGERRAESTKNFLIGLGIEPGRLITKSWGEEKPLDLGKTEEAYALNRRAEFFAIRTSE
jgi:peptidoglycan-associated lipoprotein